LDSLNRRRPCQRNAPGKIAAVGVSIGSRQNKLFGWVRNLLKAHPDTKQHESNISSLFGVFYALLRSQVPWLTNQYENVITQSGMPRLDQTGQFQFTIPFFRPLIFRGYPLAPPEGYLSQNYSKWIHRDSYWSTCPWAVYWNLVREQKEGKIGPESGASFFISDYGIRIINAANTCVIWNVSLWHGTGYYNNGLSHLGIALLLSQNLENVWKKYKEKLESGELNDNDILDYLSSSEDEN